jgi:multisubunit Na+/H+ antiporter MnhE subunit
MLHAAAMLIGFFILALLVFAQRSFGEAATFAGLIAAASTAFAMRFGGSGPTLWGAPRTVLLGAGRAGAALAGAVKTVRAAFAADVTLNPALVRVKLRTRRDFSRAVMADLASAAPGAVVVEMESDGALVHVTDEGAIDAAELGDMEARVIAALDREAQS